MKQEPKYPLLHLVVTEDGEFLESPTTYLTFDNERLWQLWSISKRIKSDKGGFDLVDNRQEWREVPSRVKE